LWRRAFYDPFDFIDEEGQPKFDVTNYKEVLGANSVVVDGIKRMVHPKNQDNVWMQVDLADRTRALKDLSNYIGLASGEDSGSGSFVVNVSLNGEQEQKKHDFKVVEYKKPDII
jgi:hypothetical protein